MGLFGVVGGILIVKFLIEFDDLGLESLGLSVDGKGELLCCGVGLGFGCVLWLGVDVVFVGEEGLLDLLLLFDFLLLLLLLLFDLFLFLFCFVFLGVEILKVGGGGVMVIVLIILLFLFIYFLFLINFKGGFEGLDDIVILRKVGNFVVFLNL